jgi:hypothetical protein
VLVLGPTGATRACSYTTDRGITWRELQFEWPSVPPPTSEIPQIDVETDPFGLRKIFLLLIGSRLNAHTSNGLSASPGIVGAAASGV